MARNMPWQSWCSPSRAIASSWLPTYMTTLQCFRNHGVSLLAIPQDDEGLDAGILRV